MLSSSLRSSRRLSAGWLNNNNRRGARVLQRIDVRNQIVLDRCDERLDNSLDNRYETVPYDPETIRPHVPLDAELHLLVHLEKLASESGESERMELRRVRIGVLWRWDGWHEEGW